MTARKSAIPAVPGKVGPNTKYLVTCRHNEGLSDLFDSKEDAAQYGSEYYGEDAIPNLKVYEVVAAYEVAPAGFKFTQTRL